MDSEFVVRTGDAADAHILLDLFDGAIRWMVARGATEQWGSTPFSELPARVESIQRWAASGGLRICERDGRPAAAMVVGDAQPYVSPATEPELYVVVLIGSREPFARGAGAHLLRVAEAEAREGGLGLLRVDCFAGNDGRLVRFYESCGFVPTETFAVKGWPGQVLERRLSPRAELDHLVYGVPDLAVAVREFAATTGVEPAAGGRHEGFGTANYLVGLGGASYLEIIGPDPDADVAPPRRLFGIDAGQPPRLLTWAVRTRDIGPAVARARERGYDPGDPAEMSRNRADGTVLRWQLTAETTRSTGGLVPFLIDWGESTHPTAGAIPTVELRSLALHGPDRERLSRQLDALGVSVAIEPDPKPAIHAVLATPNGAVVLR